MDEGAPYPKIEERFLTSLRSVRKLVEQGVQGGPYRSADEFVERAIVLLHEQETWLPVHAAEISSKISEGYNATKRGELIDAENVRIAIDQKKRT